MELNRYPAPRCSFNALDYAANVEDCRFSEFCYPISQRHIMQQLITPNHQWRCIVAANASEHKHIGGSNDEANGRATTRKAAYKQFLSTIVVSMRIEAAAKPQPTTCLGQQTRTVACLLAGRRRCANRRFVSARFYCRRRRHRHKSAT